MQMIVMSEGLLLNSKLMFSHTRRWYQFLSLNYFFCLFVCFLLLLLFYVILLLLIFAKIILLLSFYLIDYFFKKNYFIFFHVPACPGMFRHVPCSGFYRRPFKIWLRTMEILSVYDVIQKSDQAGELWWPPPISL